MEERPSRSEGFQPSSDGATDEEEITTIMITTVCCHLKDDSSKVSDAIVCVCLCSTLLGSPLLSPQRDEIFNPSVNRL